MKRAQDQKGRAVQGAAHQRSPESPILRGRALYALAVATVLALGLSWPIMGMGVELMPPLWFATSRWLGAAVLVVVIMAVKGGLRRPARADYPVVASVALRYGCSAGLVFSALRFVPPGRSSILVYTASVWAVPMAIWFLGERLTALRVLAIVSGCAGVVLLINPWGVDWANRNSLIGYGLLIAAAIVMAAMTVHVRRHRWSASALELLPWQLLIAGAMILVTAFILEGPPEVHWTPSVAAIVVYQIVFASAFGAWGTVTVSRSLPAMSSTVVMMAVPAVGFASSVLLIGEAFTIEAVGGLVLILAGVGASVYADRQPTPAAPPGLSHTDL